MRPPTTYEATHVQSSKKPASSLRLRPRRRSLIGRSRAVPFLAGSLGSLRQRSEDSADDQLIVSLRDRDSHTGAPWQSNAQALQEYLMVLTPQRLPYEIQMASGWDKGFSPEELVGLMHTSSGKGWHTPRFCSYPQDLVLRFSCGHSRVRKIQILSHQYKIASRLDFWMGSRKGVQSINADATGRQSLIDGNTNADHDNNYGNNDGAYEDEDEDAGLDLVPRVDARKKNLPVLQFQKLGSISFDSNTASNFSGRELKSINVDVEGEYLRVVIRQCHVNPLNIYHQVAILALNVLGETLEDELQGESERLDFNEFEVVNGPGQGLTETTVPHSSIPVLETLEVPNLSDAVRGLSIAEIKDQPASYMDQDVEKLIVGFVRAKQDAVKVEDFASAKLYKAGYEETVKFADEIQTLNIEKHKAAENDDFDLAQELKTKVVVVKARMNTQLSQGGFVITATDESTVVSLARSDVIYEENDNEKSLIASKSVSVSNISVSAEACSLPISSIGTNGRRVPVSRRSIFPPAVLNRSSSAPSDSSSDLDRAGRGDYSGKIPAPLFRSSSTGVSKQLSGARYSGPQSSHRLPLLPRNGSKALQQVISQPAIKDRSFISSSQLILGQDDISTIHLDELTEQEQTSFSVSLQVFPSKVVSCLISRELHLRLYAIECVKEHLENENDEDDNDQQNDRTLLARAVFQVISIALTDTREKVVTLALALLDQVVKFCIQNEIPNAVTYRSLEPIFSLLLIKASDLNTRVTQGTIDRLVMLCNSFRTTPYAILPLVFKPARNTVPYRQAQSRIEIVARLVNEFGVFDRSEGKGTAGGLDFENITEFAVPYLSHTNGEVRIATRKLIIDVCKFLSKTRVEQFLPGVKPLIIESIQKELVPKKPRSSAVNSPALSRPVLRSTGLSTQDLRLSLNSSVPVPSTSRRCPAPNPLGVNLHMDSLKSLLVEPDSPGLTKPSRQSSRQRSDAAIAHQARLKMPLRSSAKATQALYTGVPRTMVKRQSALSPEDENDSTASEEIKPPLPRGLLITPRTPARPLQSKSKSSSSLVTKNSRQDTTIGNLSGSDVPKGPNASRPTQDRFCVFCDERNNAFTDEGLVVHYWNDCAMLANCSYCKIIIEVPTLADHMLKECSKRKFVKQCETCREIMAADVFLAHVAAGCIAVSETTIRCPLCQNILPCNDEAEWKEHLLNGSGCPLNKKTRSRVQKPRSLSQAPVNNLLPPVNTAYGSSVSSMAHAGSPTSPLSSSSSSSIRMESSSVHNRGMFSATVSPASSTTSLVVDKSSHYSSASPLSSSVAFSHLSQRTQHGAGANDYYHNLHHLDSVHPLDPSPTGFCQGGTVLLHSPSMSAVGAHQADNGNSSGGSGSRIPKLGNFRSASSNSVTNLTWK